MDDAVKRQLAQIFPELARRYGTCERKIAYDTIEEAVWMCQKRAIQAGIDLFYYRCLYGEHYHLSRQLPTPEEAARLNAAFWDQHEGMMAELEAYPARLDTLVRQVEALWRTMERRRRRLAGLPPSRWIVQELTARYAEQRDDVVRLVDWLEQLDALTLRHDLILARAEAILAHEDDMRAAMAAWAERREALEAEAEDDRQAMAAGLGRQLAHMEVAHAANLERARAYLTAHYLRPA